MPGSVNSLNDDVPTTTSFSSASSSGWRDWISHHRSILQYTTLFLFIVMAGGPFAVLIYMLIRYMWLRLCKDPFLSPNDSLPGILWETFTSFPPNPKRHLPTLCFLLGFGMAVYGSIRSKTVGYNEVKADRFLAVAFNGYGSLLILAVAVWLVDGLYLCYLFVMGKRGDAVAWWYQRQLMEASETVYIPIATDNINRITQEEENDGNERTKSFKLDARRTSAKRRMVLILALYSWWTVWAYLVAHHPRVLELSIPVPKLPPACDGYKVAMASDLHAGSMSGANETHFMVDTINSMSPDVVALVGDVGDQPVNEYLRHKLEPLGDLQATDGVFVTFGNHENKHHIDHYRDLWRNEHPFVDSLTLLENEHTILTRGNTEGCSIVLIGMADWSGFGRKRDGQVEPDLTRALHTTPGSDGSEAPVDQAPSSELPMIMMQHQPKNMTGAAEAGIGLQLSGHTHGGQLWPQHVFLFIYDAISGLSTWDIGSPHGPSYLFVSEGVVGWGPRLRFLSKTDLALLTLWSPEAMKAEGLEVDTHMTLATGSMYFAAFIVPISLITCFVPCCCWAKQCFKEKGVRGLAVDTSSGDGEDHIVV